MKSTLAILGFALSSALCATALSQGEIHSTLAARDSLERRLSLGLLPWEILSAKPVGVKKMVVFGDSLSDTGNSRALLLKSQTAANPALWPEKFYKDGRWTNGNNWVDSLSKNLGASVENLAYGGSTSDANFIPGQGVIGEKYLPDQMPGLVQQTSTWVAKNKGKFTKDIAATTLFTVWSGANDYFHKPDAAPATVVKGIVTSLNALAAAGAKNIVVFNLPPASGLPWVTHNFLLASEILKFDFANPDIKVVSMAMEVSLAYVILNAQSFGYHITLQNATTPCITQPDITNFNTWSACASPELMWDVHPTEKTHGIIAGLIRKELVNHNILSA
ncbi:GDSL-like Lipase/Acylhydrolase-domain-containing protein [Fimicolochytrium jonesii]|uniref:GDSL-like Lipase/Acylhydrolase-domain-containing protein n=1 Tax=Fimicolochytrium jonesii TaxID=1396493 RepID=UPI0022FF3547|nr:GDSL-like Lipase/Acylhydrolase-domain-containing protein [Fimicolochytrium jonesii]KAI8826602.1 GDSL-like Lipase/Acylhydrolase-domain-containing protein [Fimicolochytrium jonesii]